MVIAGGHRKVAVICQALPASLQQPLQEPLQQTLQAAVLQIQAMVGDGWQGEGGASLLHG